MSLFTQIWGVRRLIQMVKDQEGPPPPAKGTALRLSVDFATRKGQIRSENQDAVCAEILAPGVAVLAVCDGVGGHPGGAEASQTAVKAIMRSLVGAVHTGEPLSPIAAVQAIKTAAAQFKQHKLQGLTTAVVALIDHGRLHYATLGSGSQLFLLHKKAGGRTTAL